MFVRWVPVTVEFKPACGICVRPLADNAYICASCSRKLEHALADIPARAREVTITATRQARIGSGDGGRKSSEVPLPFDWNASDLGWTLTNTLGTWARHIAAERGIELPGRSVTDVVVWLLGQVEWMRHRPEVVEMADEIGWLSKELERAVDHPADRWYAGVCGAVSDEQLVDAVFGGPLPTGCPTELYAILGAKDVTCPNCGKVHSVDARRKYLLASAEDRWLSAADIARAVSQLGGTAVTGNRIRKWRFRGRLHVRGVTSSGVPTYHCGDVLDLLAQDMTRSRAQEPRSA